ncbi:MAG: TetR/AcrR family transcriptional regulator [Actinomycetota bacterium]
MAPRLTRQRRQQILEAAALVIADRGLSDTRVADIGARAGVSAALVLYYFGSKDHLLTEALTFADDRFYLETFHELAKLERARDRLVRLIDLALPRPDRAGDTLGDWVLWLELWSRALRDPEVARKREALDRRWRDTISDVVRDGQRAGEFADVEAETFALRLASLIDGLAIQVVLRDPACTTDRARRMALETAGRELGFETDAALRKTPVTAGGRRGRK